MSKKYVIYTALFGNYDKLVDPDYVDHNCDYICITNQINIVSNIWTIRYICDDSTDGVYLNRRYKMMPHKYFSEYEYSIYVDTNIRLKGPISSLIEKYMKVASIAMPIHYERNCIYSEANKCLQIGKINKESYYELINNLLDKNNFPHGFGLGENNIIIRNLHDVNLTDAMEYWWDLFNLYAKRDQLTLMYVLWRKNIAYTLMKESARNRNNFFGYRLHSDCDNIFFIKRVLCYISSVRNQNYIYKLIGRSMDIYDLIKYIKKSHLKID